MFRTQNVCINRYFHIKVGISKYFLVVYYLYGVGTR